MAKSKYTTERLLRLDGSDHEAGESVDLDKKTAKPLLALGAISADKIPDSKSDETKFTQDQIVSAIKSLNPDNSELFTANNIPQVKAVEEVLGGQISAADRDAAWDSISTELSASGGQGATPASTDEIVQAIKSLDANNTENWNESGSPKAEAIALALEKEVSDEAAAAAWKIIVAENSND